MRGSLAFFETKSKRKKIRKFPAGGGGQPLGVTDEIRKARREGLMKDDRGSKERCSHLNPDVKKLYDEFLGKPLSDRSHHLLHTSYQKRELYKK